MTNSLKHIFTDVFPPHINPVHPGPYMVERAQDWALMEWDGRWLLQDGAPSAHQHRRWYGIAYQEAVATVHSPEAKLGDAILFIPPDNEAYEVILLCRRIA